MALPALASLIQFQDLLGEQILGEAEARARAVLNVASVRVRAYARENWVDADGELEDVPDTANTVTLMVATRLWSNPNAMKQITTGPFSATADVVGLALTDDEKAMLNSATSRVYSGLGVISTTRGPLETGSIYVDVAGSDEPLPVGPYPS